MSQKICLECDEQFNSIYEENLFCSKNCRRKFRKRLMDIIYDMDDLDLSLIDTLINENIIGDKE